jgi:hypothetical protein
MMQHQMDRLWAIERTRSPAEQRAADVRAGMLAAGIARAVHGVSRRTRLVTLVRHIVSGNG